MKSIGESVLSDEIRNLQIGMRFGENDYKGDYYEKVASFINDLNYKLLRRSNFKGRRNPCNTCDIGAAGCGCPEEREYRAFLKAYKDAGLLNAAEVMQNLCDLEDKIRDLNYEVVAGKQKLADMGFDLEKLFPDERIETVGVDKGTGKMNAF